MKFTLISGALAALLAGHAHAANVIQNGGFEADGVAVQSPDAIQGWSSAEDNIFGGVMVEGSTASPVSGYATVGASSGQFYGLIDLIAPSRASLSQNFSLGAPVSSASLSFDLFVNYATIGTETTYTDAAQGLSLDVDNVQVRVDILNAGASAFSTSAADVVFSQNLWQNPLAAGPNGYQHYAVNLNGSLLQSGQNYTLRFAAVNTLGSLQVGVDNVALNVSAVPEPASLALALAAIGLMVALRVRRS